MPPLPILTTEFTRQLELCVTPKETLPDDPHGPKVLRFGNTTACKQNDPWPPSRVFGFNHDDVPRLPEILAFFGNTSPIFYLVHARFTPQVGQALNAAGYYLHDWKQTILYGLPTPQAPTLPPEITIELVTPQTIDLAAEIAAQANEWPPHWREEAKNGVRKSIHRQHLQLFLARYQNEPAGICELSRSTASDTWCSLRNAAVIPTLRRRGIHTAMVHHRLHVASQQNYQLVIGGADFGSPSFRNQQRAGLRLAYIETIWKKSP
jgi:hypothetical protein